MNDLTRLFRRMEEGDRAAVNELMNAVYDELRLMAAARMAREPTGQTLQATALVHEAWLRLGGENQPRWQNRAHFFGAAAEAMRRIMIDAARRKRSLRHGGELTRLAGDDVLSSVAAETPPDTVLELHESIDRLAQTDPRKADLVKLRYFVGLTIDEAAEILGVSPITAKRDWAFARAWLFDDMQNHRL